MVLSVLKSAEAPGSKLHEKPLGYPADLRDIPKAGYPGRNQDILLLGYPALNQDIPIKVGYPTLGRDIPKVGYPNPTRDISLLGYLAPDRDIPKAGYLGQNWDIQVQSGISWVEPGYPAKSDFQTLFSSLSFLKTRNVCFKCPEKLSQVKSSLF